MNHLSATSPIEARGTTIQNTSKPLNTPIVTTWYPVSGPFREANFDVTTSIHENLNPSIALRKCVLADYSSEDINSTSS